MACANRKQQPSSLVEDFNTLNLFGKCQPEDLIFCNEEEKKREKKFIEAQKKREIDLRKQEQKRKEEEKAFKEYMKEVEKKELRKINGISHAPSKSRGRGSLLNGGISEIRPRGRSRLSPEEMERLALFDRAQKVRKNLQQFSESSLHNNAVQKSYWTGLGINKEEEEFDRYTSDSYNTSYTDSSSTSDQYEDAENSPYTSSPVSFNSVPSRSSGSPASAASPVLEPPASINLSPLQPLTHPEVASSSPRTRKPRVSRLAAKFSNNVNEEPSYNEFEQNNTSDEKAVVVASGTGEDREDPLAVLGTSRAPTAPLKFRLGHRSAGISFNSLNPSQRVLSNDILRPAKLYYADAGASNDFTLDINDFPAL